MAAPPTMRGVKLTLISAAFATHLGDSPPDEIVYIPEGSHDIFPTVNGKPKAVTVNVPPERGAAIAAALQSDLQKRHAANVRPWFDFEHKRGAASALPKSFRYEAGRGIIAAVEWTGAGKAAIAGKDFSYFSPEFLMNDDGTPGGLPERGPLGGLLNEPAFREIPRIAASDAAESEITPSPTMKLILAALGLDPAAAEAETAGVRAVESLRSEVKTVRASLASVETERDELKTKVAAAEAEAAKSRKERADSLVKAAVADGRILAKDEDKQTKFRDKIAAGDAFAEDVLADLPKLHGNLTTPVVRVAAGQAAPAGTLEDRAKQLVQAGQAKTVEEGVSIVMASDPAAYSDYLATLG